MNTRRAPNIAVSRKGQVPDLRENLTNEHIPSLCIPVSVAVICLTLYHPKLRIQFSLQQELKPPGIINEVGLDRRSWPAVLQALKS